MHDDLAKAFQATRYRVFLDGDSCVLRIGAPCPAALANWLTDHAGTRCAWLVTACNPGAQAIDAVRNQARHTLLREWSATHSSAWLNAVNEDPMQHWPDEPSVLIAGVEEGEVRALARRLGQVAVIAASASQSPTLIWCEQVG